MVCEVRAAKRARPCSATSMGEKGEFRGNLSPDQMGSPTVLSGLLNRWRVPGRRVFAPQLDTQREYLQCHTI